MSTVLYLSNQQIQVVIGNTGTKKITVQDAYTAEVPEGSLINGIIMDSESFIQFMKEFWQKNNLPSKDVTLVVNSSKFVGKTIELPKLSDAKTLDYIDREFVDIRKDEDEIYGYIPLTGGSEKLNRIYAESISAEFIKEYLDIFREIGIRIKAIYSGESSLIGLTGMTIATQYQTFMMMIADNMTLTTLLWVEGSFYYFNSVRCFHEQGTEEYAMDVARTVSQVIQFMKAHQIEHELEAIRIAGIASLDTSLYQAALSGQGIDVSFGAFDSTRLSAHRTEVQNYLHGASGLVVNGKHQNFLNQYLNRRRKKTDEESIGAGGLLIAAAFAVMVVLMMVCLVFMTMKQSKVKALEEQINDPVVLDQLNEYEMFMERNSFLQQQYDAIEDLNENITSYPVCNDDVLRVIEECRGSFAIVQFDSFDADQGLVSVTARAENVDDINKFIKELNERELFKKIDYTGYSYDEQTALWDIHVTCTLTEAAGR